MLETTDLLNIVDAIKDDIGADEALTRLVFRLNANGLLAEYLDSLGYGRLLLDVGRRTDSLDHYPNGKILVVGASSVSKDVLLGVGKKLGISKGRFELLLEYDDSVKFDFGKTRWNPKYALILLGPEPHSGISKGDSSSVITRLGSGQGFPPVVRLGSGGLKITKSDFCQKLEIALNKGLITKD